MGVCYSTNDIDYLRLHKLPPFCSCQLRGTSGNFLQLALRQEKKTVFLVSIHRNYSC